MSSKHLPTRLRINEHERRLERIDNDLAVTADRTARQAHKQVIRVAHTVDDGNYPPDPGSQSNTQTYLLPIVFDDARLGGYFPGQVNLLQQPQSSQVMQYALCNRWYEPGTRVDLFHQNRIWIEVQDRGKKSDTTYQKAIEAWATIGALSEGNPDEPARCVDPLPVDDLQEIFWGIFQLPWTGSATIPGDAAGWADGTAAGWADGEAWVWAAAQAQSWGWADGDAVIWADGDTAIWAAAEDSGSLSADNPMHLCGRPGDVVLLGYAGEDKAPYVKEVFHTCNTIKVPFWDSNECALKYDSLEFCAPTTYWRLADDPDGQASGTIVDFEVQTLLADFYYDPNTCCFEVIYQDVCTFLAGDPSDPLCVLALNEIQDPCCPCPSCPDDCSGCDATYLFEINDWSTPDCGCMNQINLPLFHFGVGNCEWEWIDEVCTVQTVGGLRVGIACVQGRWLMSIDYDTAANNNDLWVDTVIDLGPAGGANPCPPKGTFMIPAGNWNYAAGSYVCIHEATQVILS